MDTMTKKMSEAGSGRPVSEEKHHGGPKKGDRFRCDECGMELQITVDCRCEEEDHVHFHCCGQELHKV